jgi:hypothetical protein
VESHQIFDQKSDRLSRKIQNQFRRTRKAFKRKFFNKEALIEKDKLNNVIATMASNILHVPPSNDSGYSFAYETEKVVAVDIFEVLQSADYPEAIVIKMDIEGRIFSATKSFGKNISTTF